MSCLGAPAVVSPRSDRACASAKGHVSASFAGRAHGDIARRGVSRRDIPRHPFAPRRSASPPRAREDSYDMGSYDPEMDGYVPPDISLANLTLGDKVGEGSFGDVYRAVVADPNGGPPIAAIAKAYKRNVRGRDWFSFYADERAVCRRLAEVGCAGVAPFLGVCGSDAYLVWADVGVVTLSAALERDAGSIPTDDESSARSNPLRRVADEIGLGPDADAATTWRALARGLVAANLEMHGAGVVHRDVKPDNAVLTSPAAGSLGGCVALIDLGACADFETGQGCDGDEAVFDPAYGAPEQFVRERKAGIAGGFAGMFAAVAGDTSAGIVATGAPPTPAFDAFSVGLVLLRAAVPALHPPGAMKLARAAMDAAAERVEQGTATEGDSVLGEWAVSPGSASCDFGLLDEVGGWELVEGLATWDPERRMTLQEAAEHPCLRED